MATIDDDISAACEPEAAEHTDLWTVARRLRTAGRRDLALACEARLTVDVRRAKDEPPFRSDALPNDTTIDSYRRAETAAPLAMVRARFSDLLWLRTGDHHHARRAVDAYLQAWHEPFGSVVTGSDGLIRAYEIARRLQDPTLVAATRDAVAAAAEESLTGPESPAPGATLPLIESLLSERSNSDHVERLATLADSALGADPRLFNSMQAMRARLLRGRPAAQRELWRQAVSRHAEAAHSETGLRRMAHLQTAVEPAEAHGLSDEAASLRAQIRAIPEDELELATISAQADIPAEDVDRYVQQIVGDDGIVQALLRLGASAPGFHDGDLAEAMEHLARSPLLSLHPHDPHRTRGQRRRRGTEPGAAPARCALATPHAAAGDRG